MVPRIRSSLNFHVKGLYFCPEGVNMKNFTKYDKGYYMPPEQCTDWCKKDSVEQPPIWCSVDLRDGNQALVTPMSLEEKLEFFGLLVKIGFKEIEVGFPAASETEFTFLRTLIENNLIPDDVTVQVLTQSREHIIRRTFEALKGCKKAIVHLYNSTSVAQREQVFGKDKKEIIGIATEGAKLIKRLAKEDGGNYLFEYSPESFTGTEPEFALEICNEVIKVLEPTPERPLIINLPSTVETSMPHVYACQVEYMHKHLERRDSVLISLHPHNDRGCGVSDAEMGLLAGADRVEGTLFGNGERTGNVDIITLAMNMFTHGVDPMLDFSDIPSVRAVYERLTNMTVPPRQPYAGQLVFTAFSGSHQDAIAKGLAYRKEHDKKYWDVPYLPIDPADIGRNYDGDVIRINSQSGKGGVSYLLEQSFGYHIPKNMREAVGYAVKNVSDHAHKELLPDEVLGVFTDNFVNIESPLSFVRYTFNNVSGGVQASVTVREGNKTRDLIGTGNGALDAVSNALKSNTGIAYSNLQYSEHALEEGSHSRAAAYVGITDAVNHKAWAVGIDNDIMRASIKALIGAINKLKTKSDKEFGDN